MKGVKENDRVSSFRFGVFRSNRTVIIVSLIADGVCKHRNKRELQKAKKTYDRMKKIENTAVFTALATAYGKDK